MANADHYIDKEAEYIRVLKTAEKAVQKYPNQTVLIGLKPGVSGNRLWLY